MLRKQKQTDLIRLFRFVIPSRLELEMSEPKSDVLPLHHGTIPSGNRKLIAFSIISIPFLRVQRYYVFLF